MRKSSEQKLIKNGYEEMVYINAKSIFVKDKLFITLLKNGSTRTTTKKDFTDCGV